MVKVSFIRAIKAGTKNFMRNGWLSLATTSVIALTLFIISVLLALIFVSNLILNQIQDKISVNVYFQQDVSDEKVAEIKKELELMPEIKRVDFTSREDALSSLKDKYQNNEVIIDSIRELKENPLEASLSIKVYDSNKYETLENELIAGKYKDYVSKMDYSDHKQEIDRLNSIIASIRKVGLVMIITLVIVAVLVTFNSIRLTMYTYRVEVEIMKLVGASNWFIRLPFITEGILYGIIATVIVAISWYPLTQYLVPFFANSGIEINPMELLKQNIVYIFFIELLIGVTLGAISSLIAIRRYLKM